MNKRNMKIAITPEQPLDEVVKELERLGYRLDYTCASNPKFVVTWGFGFYDTQSMNDCELVGHPSTTTLAELKNME